MEMISVSNAVNWAKELFGLAKLGDSRRTKRLVNVAGNLAEQSGNSLASVCNGEKATVLGSYRLIENDSIVPDDIRQAGFEYTAQLAQDIPEMLALEDTTSLSYKHSVAPELGKLGQPGDKSRGWWVHSTLLVNTETTQTVGLIHQEWWQRPDDPKDADVKESGKWQSASEDSKKLLKDTIRNVIFVCDREADIFDYIDYKTKNNERFIIRSKHPRKVNDSMDSIREHLKKQPILGGALLDIPQKGMKDSKGQPINRPARCANLHIRSASSIQIKSHNKTIELNAVLVEEIGCPEGQEPLSWLLLTTEPVQTLEESLKIIRFYAMRWRVEEFHKAWKTGAGAERQRMTAPETLERSASILAFIGVRLLQLKESFSIPIILRKQGFIEEAKEVANQACDKVLSEIECEILIHNGPGNISLKNGVPTLQWAYMAIAKLGGFTDTKQTGIACWSTIYKGWTKLQERVKGYIAAKEIMQKE